MSIPLLLDVDGVVNVLGAGAVDILHRGLDPHDAVGPDGRAYRLLIAPGTPTLLARLADRFELVWATTWRNANEVIAPLLGLPSDLGQVWFPSSWEDGSWSLCRKTPWVRRWAAERGVELLAWIDDEIGPADVTGLCADLSDVPVTGGWRRVMAGTPPLGEVLVVNTEPTIGITEEHVARLLAWANRVTDG